MSDTILPPKFLAAMIAVQALPGSPLYDGDTKKVVHQAMEDLEQYMSEDVDSVIVENDFDVPYIKPPLPKEAVSLMTTIAKEVRKKFKKPVGVQMLESANETSLQIASEAKLDFIRVEGYVYAQIGGAGLIEGCAGKLLRLRKQLGCEQIKVFADVQKKHAAHAITADLDITDEVKQAELFLVDGIVVTSKFTGIEPEKNDLIKVKKTTSLPVVIGSGMTKENIKDFFPLADGFIIGSTFRKDGKFLEQLDPKRLKDFMQVFRELRRE